MRILLTIQPINKPILNFEYYYKLQGFVYSLLKNTSFDNLHDQKKLKFFCFSNVFQNSTKPEYYHVMISSPIDMLINQLAYQLQKIIDNQIQIEIGTMFELINYKKIEHKNIKFPLRLVTASPIVLRLRLDTMLRSSINTPPYRFVYWRATHPISLFVDGVLQNLAKKYNTFYNKKPSELGFEYYNFKKQVSTKIKINNNPTTIIGTLWEFSFSEKTPKDVQLFALDCGLGERNSLGFGFINTVNTKPKQRVEVLNKC